MSNVKHFYNRLKKLRIESNLLQRSLAEMLGLAQTTIANYEQGKRFPDEETLQKIADFFNVSLDYLLGRSEIKNYNEDFILRDSIQLSKCFIEPEMLLLKNSYFKALINGKSQKASEMILNAVTNDMIDIKKIYNDVFERSLIEIGQQWDMNIIDIYQEHYFSCSTQFIMSQLFPYFHTSEKNGHSLISLSTSGDSHNIGIRMVTDFFEIDGWNTYFLGCDVPSQSVIKAIKDRKANIVAISCTMPNYLESVQCLITAIRNLKDFSDVKIIVGGRLFNRDKNLWKSVGADGYSSNADEAVKIANEFMINNVLE
ncbi:cobalamin-dependent protein [Clostridium estertheticum]|uniref:cobalamin-dependent protein n=1 Tax=Clostridium estertheticum TaxID=238834 RepID=UPI001CF0D648|nr:cobalamin-dependent protein [Clostridium estertheticum]MCB2356715.1 cobalamin-dependent protein [Clostridium estertheticum]WAG39745.1 cobalamin-dependent protein [Clostridium estertheticum]